MTQYIYMSYVVSTNVTYLGSRGGADGADGAEKLLWGFG
jgi:hypothetical protein